MKPSEYPTPENDSFDALMSGTDVYTHLIALDLFARNLEQRLAACRDVLACINASQIMTETVHHKISETLTATAKP